MVRLIIGENASGKSLYLNNLVHDAAKNMDISDFVTNTVEMDYSDYEFSAEKLEILAEATSSDEVAVKSGMLVFENSPYTFSMEFVRIMTLLCYDCDFVYLDEPEQGLSECEINILANYITYSYDLYKDLVIVTQSEIIAESDNCVCYTPKLDRATSTVDLVEVPWEDISEIVD